MLGAVLTRRQKRRFFALLGIGALEAIFELVAVVSMAPILSLMLNPENFGVVASRLPFLVHIAAWSLDEKLVFLSGVFTMTYAIRMIIRLINLRFSSLFIEGLRHEVAITTLNRALDKSYLDVLVAPPAEIASKVTHDASGISAIVRDLLGIASAGTSVLMLAVAVVLTTGVTGALALSIALVIGFGILRVNLFRGKSVGMKTRESQQRLLHLLMQQIGAFREMTVFSVRHKFLDRFSAESGRFRDTNQSAKMIQRMPSIIVEGLLFVGLGLALLVVSSSEFDLATNAPFIGAFVFAIARLLPQVLQVVALTSSIQFSLVALRSISEAPTDRPSGNATNRKIGEAAKIEFEDVTYRYPNAESATLRGLSCSIPKGSVVALVGASGSGKSTFLNLVLGFLAPTSGEVKVGGETLSNAISDWHSKIAFVPQEPYFLPTTIRENIEFERKHRGDAHLWKLLEATNLRDFVEALPGGLDHPCGEGARILSGGQRQRLAISRALYSDPEVLVLDEPTSALDYQNAQIIRQTLHALKGEKTVILSTHILDFARNCDLLVLFKGDGHAIVGEAPDLLRNSQTVRDYFEKYHESVRT